MLIPSDPFPDDPNPALARVYEYWKAASPGTESNALPRLRQIELMDLHDIAPQLMIADIVRERPGRLRYRWRFWGTHLAQFFGIELTGRFIDEAYTPGAAVEVSAAYDWAVENKSPHYWVRRADNPDHLVFERLVCPLLGHNTDTVDHLFGIITVIGIEKTKRLQPERLGDRRLSFSEVELE